MRAPLRGAPGWRGPSPAVSEGPAEEGAPVQLSPKLPLGGLSPHPGASVRSGRRGTPNGDS